MPYADPEVRRAYHREYSKRWDAENPEARAEIQKRHDKKRQYAPKRRDQISDARTRRHIRQRVAVFEMYGGECAFCGSTQYEHLTIDHVKGDGKQHRAELAREGYRSVYDFLCRTEFRPNRFRILCWNCHMAMTKYGVKPDGEELHDMDYWRERGALRRRANGVKYHA